MNAWVIVAVVIILLFWRPSMAFAVKTGVQPSNRPEMEHARRIVVRVWAQYGYTVTLTSGAEADPVHLANSLHYDGLAEDYRIRDVPTELLPRMVSDVRAILGRDYDVVLESDHLHVEFDPK